MRITHGGIGIGGQRRDESDETIRHAGDRRVVEQVGGIAQDSRPRMNGVAGGHHHREVHVGRHLLDSDRRHPQVADVDTGIGNRSRRVERQDHLCEWGKRFRTHRIECLDDGFERHVGVRERLEVSGPDPVEQCREGVCSRYARPQDERVDEHTDERIEHRLTAAGGRCRHRDVVRCAQPRQQHRQRGMDHHELGGAVSVCGGGDRVGHLARELEAVVGAPV